MKMIRSTSTTSTSGVMLISDCSSEPRGPLLSCMVSVSPRLCAGTLGDQPDPVEAGLLDRVHGLPDLAEAEPGVAADHDLRVRPRARRRAESFAKTLRSDLLVLDPQAARLVDGDEDPASLVALLARLRRARQVDVR